MEVPNNEFGAPWNDVEKEVYVTITLRTCVTASFKGPSNPSQHDIEKVVKEHIKDAFASTDYSVEDINFD